MVPLYVAVPRWLLASIRLHSMRRIGRRVCEVVLVAGLAWFFVAGAAEHARTVNTSKARADQSGYLWDAQQVYANWHGRTPPVLIGQRMRMPVYAGFLALAWDPAMTNAQFFEVAKTWNIRLSLLIAGLLTVLFLRNLPPLAATSLSLIVTFGTLIFRAGYSQPEVLSYFLIFVTFLACWHLFRTSRGAGDIWLGGVSGALGGAAFLTKASVPPFLVAFLVVYAVRESLILTRRLREHTQTSRRNGITRFVWRTSAALALAVCFLLVVFPYIVNSKRVFGSYFFNVNTAHYMWYDSGALARATMIPFTDEEGRIALPVDQLPNLRTYWRSHSVWQISGRVADGLRDTLTRSYHAFWYLKFVALYVLFVLVLAAANWRRTVDMLRDNAALGVLLLVCAGLGLSSVAFFVATSSTGGLRFLLAHVAPLLFVLSCVVSRSRLSDARLTVAGVTFSPDHFHILVLVTMCLNLTFTLWPRLMTTYGGF